jgi:hypothetical protein
VLIPDTLSLEGFLVIGLINLLENILKSTIVPLEDSVLGAQVEGIVSLQSKLEGRVSKSSDRVISVVHTHENTSFFEVEDINGFLL